MASFQEQLLRVMDQKNHWGWSQIIGPQMTKKQLLIHFQQEYIVYIRDFPQLLARVLGRMDPEAWALKREFAENIYEEQTGGLSVKFSGGISHPELFLKMMKGLGYKDTSFKNIELLPTSLGYRAYLDHITINYPWQVAAALLTLFVEGSVEDRERLKKNYKPTQNLNQKVKNHSLYKYHGLAEKDMALVRAHHMIEGSHRKSAWETLLNHIPQSMEPEILSVMTKALELWSLYRDGVCLEMGLMHKDYRSIAQNFIENDVQ